MAARHLFFFDGTGCEGRDCFVEQGTRPGTVVTAEIADVNIEGHALQFRPGVDGQVGFGKHDGARDARRLTVGIAEGMKIAANDSQPVALAGLDAKRFQLRGVEKEIGGATAMVKTGDQVEVITQKEPNPSRDWMNPNAGFLRSSRARAKVATWFRKLDRDKNIAAGKELLEKELDRHNLTLSKVDKVVLERFHAEELEDLLAGIGSGDIRINQLLNYLDTRYNKPTAEEEDRRLLEKLEQKANVPFRPKPKDHIVVEGVGNLMTHIARCCQPIPGDAIQGFITMGRGVSIHREDCEQLKELSRRNPERLIDAVWGENYSGGYGLTIRILSNDRSGLLRDITTVLANEKINVMGVRSRSNVREQTAEIDMELEIYNINAFNRALAKLSQLNDVISAKRL